MERERRLSPPGDTDPMDLNTSSDDDDDGSGPADCETENMQNSDEEVASPENEEKKLSV